MSFILTLCTHHHCQSILLEKKQHILQVKKAIECIEHEINAKSNQKITASFKKNQRKPLLNLLNTLSKTVPIGLYLSELSITQHSYHLVGYAEKIPLLSQWIIQLAKYQWYANIQIISQTQKAGDFPVKFSLSIYPRITTTPPLFSTSLPGKEAIPLYSR